MSNIKLIRQLIDEQIGSDEAKQSKIAFYEARIEQVDKLSIEQIKAHNWTYEIMHADESIKKVRALEKLVIGLERHGYAPELNELVLKNGKRIKTAGRTSIEQAVAYVCSRNTLDEIIKYSKS